MVENPQQIIRQLARHHSMNPRTMRNLINEGYRELSCHPVAASDPKRSRNEEGEMLKTPQQAEGLPP